MFTSVRASRLHRLISLGVFILSPGYCFLSVRLYGLLRALARPLVPFFLWDSANFLEELIYNCKIFPRKSCTCLMFLSSCDEEGL